MILVINEMEQRKHHPSQDTEDTPKTSMRGMQYPWFPVAQVPLVQNNPQFFLLHSIPRLLDPHFIVASATATTGRNPNHQRVGEGHVVDEIDIVVYFFRSRHIDGQ